MNNAVATWGVVLLLVFAGAHYAFNAGYSAALIWVGLAILINLLNFWMGKQMKRAPKGSQEVWMSLGVFGFLATLAVAFGVVPVSLSWLMSLWLLLFGAAMFAGGQAMKSQVQQYSGIVLGVASLFVPAFGPAWYFMAGALFLGLFTLVNAFMSKTTG